MIQDKQKNPLILIVDDIPKNLQVLSNILNTEGYHISFASNGKQALSVVETTLPDLILLDIMMPELDGFEVCERLKKDELTKNIPVIFLTGKAETEDIVKGFQLGAVDYVTKPFNAVELLSRVRTHLDLKLSKDSIIEYTKELESAQNELRQVIASKDKFFSIIAHDLRGPFTGFIGLSELLTEESNSLEKEEIVQIADSMNKAAKRLFEFLENLLEWSRTQMGRMEFNPSPIDIRGLFERNIALISDTATHKGITIKHSCTSNLTVNADNYMLNTIMRNMVSNAVKFTSAGDSIILGATAVSEELVEISVADTGVGMSDEAKEKVFRIDAKYSTPGTANESGSGLGLTLCRELIAKHGGEIRMESELGSGTTFFFTLPRFIVR